MNIGVIGSGYVGLVTAACLSEMGNKIFCFDKNITTLGTIIQFINISRTTNKIIFHHQ